MRLLTFSVAGGICALALLPAAPARGLSLEEALARAAQHRFEIAAIPREIRAGEGRITPGGGRNQGRSWTSRPGTCFEESSSRGEPHRTSAAASATRGSPAPARASSWLGAQADVRRLEIGHQVRKAYSAVLAAEQSFALTEESLSLARSFADTVAEKVRAGAASPIEETTGRRPAPQRGGRNRAGSAGGRARPRRPCARRGRPRRAFGSRWRAASPRIRRSRILLR